MHYATVEEVNAIADAVEPRWKALILLAAYSGLRWGELAGLRRRHLDPPHKNVRVVEQCTEVNGHFVWGPPKTSAGVRTVALPQFICDAMVDHLAHWSEPGIDGLVFVMPKGTPLRAVMYRLGHASTAAAFRYPHRVDGQDRDIAVFLQAVGLGNSPNPIPCLDQAGPAFEHRPLPCPPT